MHARFIENTRNYAIAVLSTIAATWLRMPLNSLLGDRHPFGFYFLSVLLTAWLAGTGPAVVALFLGILAAAHFIIRPESSLAIADPADQFSLLIYGLVGAVAIELFRRSAAQQRLAERRARDNEALTAELRATDRRKDEFLALLAHELRNPLAPIQAGLALLDRESSDGPRSASIRATIQRQVQQLVRILDDLLDVARFARGHCQLQSEIVDLREVIQLALETARPLIERRRHDVVTILTADPVYVWGDRVRLTQVVANILNNAAKYTPTEGRIRVFMEVRDACAVIQVVDNGIGIDRDMQPHVFDLFTQADSSATREHGGLGLGLTIVRKLVELHGGNVSVRSDGLGRGSLFEIALPVAEQAMPTPASDRPHRTSASDAAPASGDMSILIVDDNRESAEMLAALLAFEGYHVECLADGMSALQRMDTFPAAAVLLDIGLPGMDGYEFARRLRQRMQNKCPLLIAVSGWGTPQHREMSRAAGIDHHVVKPVDVSTVIDLLQSCGSAATVRSSDRRCLHQFKSTSSDDRAAPHTLNRRVAR